MLSIDAETTGKDFQHGARPFFVTICDEEGSVTYYEWDVNPLTRDPCIPRQDLIEIQQLLSVTANWDKNFSDDIRQRHYIVGQNLKFDVAALRSIGITNWPWSMTHDTLIAGHLLASNQPHDLTSMVLHYLGVDLLPYENKLKEAVQEARRVARSRFPEWKIAKAGLSDMPSAQETTWKYDYWLPKALAMELKEPDDHPWWWVLSEYSNADSEATILLWKVVQAEIERRGLWEIYLERMKVMPVVAKMEEFGVTMNSNNLNWLRREYLRESKEAGDACKVIAAKMGYDLNLPKGANNNSLRHFCFGDPDGKKWLNLPILKRTDTGAPSLDKYTIDEYAVKLERGTNQHRFVSTLRGKRKRDTALGYLESYETYWLPLKGHPGYCVIYPSLNPTGTDTLRFSCSNPNTQQVSKQEAECADCKGEGGDCESCGGTGKDLYSLRICFGPAPGREWYSLDARGIEDRLPAYKSGQQELIDIFERPTQPPYYGSNHFLRFHTVYPDVWEKEMEEVGFDKVGPTCKKKYASTYYQWVKNGGFAVQYGAVDKRDGTGTADKAFHKPGAHALLKARFSKLEALNQSCIAQANKYGYVETMPDKTVNPNRGYPLMCSRTDWGQVKPTVPLNYHIQGTAMWWMMKAMIRCQAKLNEWNQIAGSEDYRLIMQVHDELVFDFPKSAVHPKTELGKNGVGFRRSNLWRIKIIQKIMEQGGDDIGIPTPVSCEYHEDNWSEGVSL